MPNQLPPCSTATRWAARGATTTTTICGTSSTCRASSGTTSTSRCASSAPPASSAWLTRRRRPAAKPSFTCKKSSRPRRSTPSTAAASARPTASASAPAMPHPLPPLLTPRPAAAPKSIASLPSGPFTRLQARRALPGPRCRPRSSRRSLAESPLYCGLSLATGRPPSAATMRASRPLLPAAASCGAAAAPGRRCRPPRPQGALVGHGAAARAHPTAHATYPTATAIRPDTAVDAVGSHEARTRARWSASGAWSTSPARPSASQATGSASQNVVSNMPRKASIRAVASLYATSCFSAACASYAARVR
ncbi:pre-rRNA-processing protein ESF2 [Thecamonas trahens ATCC 50062]|uniref:Pre-rRNA-processing protein ESF2 n=1 Tax=Thecamonas trahens ATCC 50062 TaxID=461836 RepID=A0A0L0D613_THETB|nr:pre-rRNA-processing protein ESF2 [Thecamonas trahens ATCC 50062]KNC47794.1 pre-rRNA-processing protein ESF2 [Thecamonas trahens ATCC 50062]|eukprot:XP_013759272.1 pre-rRNA-processing protein ESF2 [Thecamonas trahens ATCC 50062]